jgi:hypothetical protein
MEEDNDSEDYTQLRRRYKMGKYANTSKGGSSKECVPGKSYMDNSCVNGNRHVGDTTKQAWE